MNYRHAFHAGNFADVVKHVALIMLLRALQRKPTPYCYVETHAGAGVYDLKGGPSLRTGEFKLGIGEIWKVEDPGAPEIREYLSVIAELNDDPQRTREPRRYPGSPWIASALARPNDRLEMWELHAEDARTLANHLQGKSRVAVHCGDGYASLRAALPPRERRGLVFIDPPFESDDEWEHALKYLQQSHSRWPTGLYALWYPIKHEGTVAHLHKRLGVGSIRKVLAAEMRVAPVGHPMGLYGSGLVVINPPWRFDTLFRRVQTTLTELLAPRFGTSSVEWLVPE